LGDLGGEASQRQSVTLNAVGDAITFSVHAADVGANAVVIRYSLPDAPAGGGLRGQLGFSVIAANGSLVDSTTLNLDSRYAWLYGSAADGTKLYNVPGNAPDAHPSPTHLFDDIQLKLKISLQAGESIVLHQVASNAAGPVTVDFLELENIPPSLPQPSGYLSLASCGAVALDLQGTGEVFDGIDDSSYGSQFNVVFGENPRNPVSFFVPEKVFYSTVPGVDALQDLTGNSVAGGLSMFELADKNFASFQSCIAQATAANSNYAGVWIPPGRYFMRGLLTLPSNTHIQGSGMWYSKLVAVDTAAPTTIPSPSPTPSGSIAAISSVTGNPSFVSEPTGSNNVSISNLAMFGNVTQRDTIDAVLPMGVHGQFTNSTFDHLWVEHYFIGINFNGMSANVQVTNSRVRSTFADGFDFYGSTSQSSMTNCWARNTGDDGFAVWSQSTNPAAQDSGNVISNSESQLGWYGNGFAIYGGVNTTLQNSTAADILTYPCLQASTQFVPVLVGAGAANAAMSATVENMNFYRCGGDGFSQQFGAVLLGTNTENINGISLNNIKVYSPTYKGLEMRQIPQPPNHQIAATMTNVNFSNIVIQDPPICSFVDAFTGGSAEFSNVCSCASSPASPEPCQTTNNSSATFTIQTKAACSISSCSN
jgi:hypothetical protein